LAQVKRTPAFYGNVCIFDTDNIYLEYVTLGVVFTVKVLVTQLAAALAQVNRTPALQGIINIYNMTATPLRFV
jgi:hypothetical protein